jgi:HSF-type DNA-binding
LWTFWPFLSHFLLNTDQSNNARVLGRIVVHDRVLVEANVLPRYFNHSSFASLRRQLNYFSFVRLGKGRQRESTYINENVVVLDDILHLKRRPSTGNVIPLIRTRMEDPLPFLTLSESSESSMSTLERRPKRRRQTKESVPTTVSPRSTSPVCNHLETEVDDSYRTARVVVLDLTKPELNPDADILDGCRGLLFLSARRW